MAGDKEIGDKTRNQMMQNLFGEQSGEEEEEEQDVDSEHDDAAKHSDYQSDDGLVRQILVVKAKVKSRGKEKLTGK